MAIIYSIAHSVFEHPQIKYFVCALKINHPLTVSKKYVIDIPTLERIIALCEGRLNAVTFKAVFLTGYFGYPTLLRMLSLSLIRPNTLQGECIL